MKALVARPVWDGVLFSPVREGCHYWCSCSVWRGKAVGEHSLVLPEYNPPLPLQGVGMYPPRFILGCLDNHKTPFGELKFLGIADIECLWEEFL